MNGELTNKHYNKCAAAIAYDIVQQTGCRIGEVENMTRKELISAKESEQTFTITVEKTKKGEDIHHLNIKQSTYKNLKMVKFKKYLTIYNYLLYIYR